LPETIVLRLHAFQQFPRPNPQRQRELLDHGRFRDRRPAAAGFPCGNRGIVRQAHAIGQLFLRESLTFP